MASNKQRGKKIMVFGTDQFLDYPIKPIEPIRASEFLRQAVDNHLACTIEECLEGKYRGLYKCLQREAGDNQEKILAKERILDELEYYMPEPRDYLPYPAGGVPFEQQQAIRFTFTEFLALYFEDMGD